MRTTAAAVLVGTAMGVGVGAAVGVLALILDRPLDWFATAMLVILWACVLVRYAERWAELWVRLADRIADGR